MEEIYAWRSDQAIERRSADVEKLSVEECQELLIELIRGQPTILIIDALDEVDPNLRYILLRTLRGIIEGLDESSFFKLFVSSRDDQDIVLEFQACENIYINAADNQSDIDRFLDIQIQVAIASKRILYGKVPDDLRVEISRELRKKARGM